MILDKFENIDLQIRRLMSFLIALQIEQNLPQRQPHPGSKSTGKFFLEKNRLRLVKEGPGSKIE